MMKPKKLIVSFKNQKIDLNYKINVRGEGTNGTSPAGGCGSNPECFTHHTTDLFGRPFIVYTTRDSNY